MLSREPSDLRPTTFPRYRYNSPIQSKAKSRSIAKASTRTDARLGRIVRLLVDHATVVASGTKALTGHSDVLLGYLAAGPELAGRTRAWRNSTGAVPGPFEAWLAHRSLSTLDLRLARQSANAGAVAELLAGRPEVTDLRWPGRPGDPAYPVASRQMRRIPGIVAFTLADAGRVARFLQDAELVFAATSFGGTHTSADRRAQWGDPVAEGMVRLSCGIEDTADLLADLTRALDHAAA